MTEKIELIFGKEIEMMKYYNSKLKPDETHAELMSDLAFLFPALYALHSFENTSTNPFL